MCLPAAALALTSFALSAASGIASYQAGSAQAKMQTHQYNENKKNALLDYQKQLVDSGTRQMQEAQAASENMTATQRNALARAAAGNAAVAETGTSGYTVGALLSQVLGDAGRDATTQKTNLDWQQGQLAREREGIRSSTISRINSAAPGVKPSGLAAALQIGASGLNSYTAYKTGKFG